MGAGGASCEGHQRDVAGALDGYTEPTLVTRANSGHAARENLAALLHELGKNVGTLVVDEVHFLDAELADFLFAEILTLAAARATWASTGTSGTAFAASTARTTFAAGTGVRVSTLTARGSATFTAVRGSWGCGWGCGGIAAFRGCWRRGRCGLHWFLFL